MLVSVCTITHFLTSHRGNGFLNRDTEICCLHTTLSAPKIIPAHVSLLAANLPVTTASCVLFSLSSNLWTLAAASLARQIFRSLCCATACWSGQLTVGVLLLLVAGIIDRTCLAVFLIGRCHKRTHFMCHMRSSGVCVGLGNRNMPGEGCLCQKRSRERLCTGRCDGGDGCGKGSLWARKEEVMVRLRLVALSFCCDGWGGLWMDIYEYTHALLGASSFFFNLVQSQIVSSLKHSHILHHFLGCFVQSQALN